MKAEMRQNPVTHKSSLTDSQARLVELMQWLNYGRIEFLHFRNGEPVFNPKPRVFRRFQFKGKNGPRPEAVQSDFELKNEVKALFAHMRARGDGVIENIDVHEGLPSGMTYEEDVA